MLQKTYSDQMESNINIPTSDDDIPESRGEPEILTS